MNNASSSRECNQCDNRFIWLCSVAARLYLRLDFDFHRRILQAIGNQAMLGIVTSNADIFLEIQKLPFICPERGLETRREHTKILKALRRHAKGPAQKAMQQHIRAAALRTGIAFVTLED